MLFCGGRPTLLICLGKEGLGSSLSLTPTHSGLPLSKLGHSLEVFSYQYFMDMQVLRLAMIVTHLILRIWVHSGCLLRIDLNYCIPVVHNPLSFMYLYSSSGFSEDWYV
jgi:hypothetical protein